MKVPYNSVYADHDPQVVADGQEVEPFTYCKIRKDGEKEFCSEAEFAKPADGWFPLYTHPAPSQEVEPVAWLHCDSGRLMLCEHFTPDEETRSEWCQLGLINPAPSQEVGPVAWTTKLALDCRAESFAFEVCPKNIWGDKGVPLYTHPAPLQEGHAAGPACSAPKISTKTALAIAEQTGWSEDDVCVMARYICETASPAPDVPVRRWQHEETGRVCETSDSPGKRWHEIPAAPDEALIEEIAWSAYDTWSKDMYMQLEEAFRLAIREYIRRSALKATHEREEPDDFMEEGDGSWCHDPDMGAR